MRFLLVILVMLAWSAGGTERPLPDRGEIEIGLPLLRKAFARKDDLKYIARVNQVDPTLPADHVGVYQRQVGRDGFVYKRLDLFVRNQIVETYIENKAGQYGTINGCTAEIMEVLLLSRLENLYEPISSNELEVLSRYEIREVFYNGIPCYELKIRFRPDLSLAVFYGISNLSVPETEKNENNPLIRLQPYLRVFLIGKSDHLIYARKHYNVKGIKISEIELGKVQINPHFDASAFETPEYDGKTVFFRNDLRSLSRQDVVLKVRQEKASKRRNAALERQVDRWGRWVVSHGVYFLLPIGIVCLLGIAYIRLRER